MTMIAIRWLFHQSPHERIIVRNMVAPIIQTFGSRIQRKRIAEKGVSWSAMVYTRLTDTDRETIMTMLAQEKGATEIAAALGRAVCTITREVHRHLCSNGMYSSISAL
jgi:hypothetical protein